MLFLETRDVVDDPHATLAADIVAEFDDAFDLRDFGGVLRLAGLEELGDTRQTARNIAGLRSFTRGLREEHAGRGLHAVADHDDRARRNVVRIEHLVRRAVFGRAADDDTRMEVGLTGIENDERLRSGRSRS